MYKIIILFYFFIEYSVQQFDIYESYSISGHKFYWAQYCEFEYISPPVIITNNYDLRIESIEKCAEKCVESSECTHFTLYKDDDGCFLYSGIFRYVNDARSNKNNNCGILKLRTGLHVYEIKFGMTNNYGIELVNKCDFTNQDLFMIETNNLNECGEKCSENEYCTHFSNFEMKCFLKTGIRTEKEAVFSSNYTCGILKTKMLRRRIVSKTGFTYNWEKYCDFNGQDLNPNGIQVVDFQDCIERCTDHGFECTHFTYVETTLKCYLKYGNRNISDYLVRPDRNCGILEFKRIQQIF